MLAGVTIVDPATTWIEAGVELEPDVVVHPFTVLRGRTTVAAGAEIGPHAVAVDAAIGAGALVGPFCYLRPGTVLEAGAKAGTFVEIKNSRIGARTKVPHLSYIGDADIGEDTNIAAGERHRQLLAPAGPAARAARRSAATSGPASTMRSLLRSGRRRCLDRAGSVITEDVPPGSLAVSRRGRRRRKDGSTSMESRSSDD